jgi:hypothetical protein
VKDTKKIFLTVFYICFGMFFLTAVYNTAKDATSDERSLAYTNAEKQRIELASSELCSPLVKEIKCSSLEWVGKNKPFGRVSLEILSNDSHRKYFFEVLEKNGWGFYGSSSSRSSTYARGDMRLIVYAIDGDLKHITLYSKH